MQLLHDHKKWWGSNHMRTKNIIKVAAEPILGEFVFCIKAIELLTFYYLKFVSTEKYFGEYQNPS